MKRHNVIESNVEPKDNSVLWLQGNKLKKFGNTGWEDIIGGDVVTTDRIENGAVTTGKLEPSIQSLIKNISKNASFAGIATPSTNPGTPDGPVFYIANGKGTYTNFGGIDVTEDEVVILYYDTIWHKNATGIASNDKLTDLNSKIGYYWENKQLVAPTTEKYLQDLKEGDVLYVKFTEAGGALGFFNESGERIMFIGGHGSLTTTEAIRTIPEGFSYAQPIWGNITIDYLYLADSLLDIANRLQAFDLTQVVYQHTGKNLYDSEDNNIIDGKYINSNGDIATYTETKVSPLIPIELGQSLIINKKSSLAGNVICNALFDGDGKYITGTARPANDRIITYSRDVVYARTPKYARFSIPKSDTSGNVVTNIQIELGVESTEYVPFNPIGGYTESNFASKTLEENLGYADVICCDGDSLTWGHLGKSSSNVDLGQSAFPYPSVLQKYLGDRFLVKNYGIPGAYSTTIEGASTSYQLLEDVTIPAGVGSGGRFYVKLAFFRNRDGNNVNQFGPVMSHETPGGAEFITIRGVKCRLLSSVLRSGDTIYSAYLERLIIGDEVSAKAGDIALTYEYDKYRGATHIIFMGANGGWKIDGTSSIHSDTNISELMGQIDDVRRMSSNRYLVLSYWGWLGTNSPKWEGENKFLERYGNHYLNLREYFSTNAIQDAINAGYISSATPADETAMAQGRIPPSFMNANTADIHLNDIGYHVLGDVVSKKYAEIFKKDVLGQA